MDGILLIDKPKGWTSFDVVAKVRGVVKAELRKVNPQLKNVKVGHTGTLDPFASGLLILVLGSYCKRAGEFSGLSKTYSVTALLGQESTTGDPEGELTDVSDSVPEASTVTEKVMSFVGEISQTPPSYSAVKVNGQRAYKLARAGKSVQLEPRNVTVQRIEDISYSYPALRFTARVSSGTYIRSLVSDIGSSLGTGAYTSELQRVSVGDYSLADAMSISRETTFRQIEQALRSVK